MPTTTLQRARPNAGGTITKGGQTYNYAPSPGQNLDPNRAGSGGTIDKSGVTRAYTPGKPMTQLNPRYDESQDATPVAPRPAVGGVPTRSIATRTPTPPPNLAGLSGFALQNTANNAGIYAPGSVGEANARANGTGYRPPQQTERANPLSGDNNLPPEGVTTRVNPSPFSQRGGSLPGGQDTASAVKGTLTEDGDIASSMAGTQARIGGSGAFSRKFGSNQAASAYDSYVKRLFPSGS